jgi:hypothetical protein
MTIEGHEICIQHPETTRPVTARALNQVTTPPYEPPQDLPTLTQRDLDYSVLYMQILDAAKAGADWQIVARDVLALDPASEAAKSIYDQFHARAIWMTKVGFRLLANLPQ